MSVAAFSEVVRRRGSVSFGDCPCRVVRPSDDEPRVCMRGRTFGGLSDAGEAAYDPYKGELCGDIENENEAGCEMPNELFWRKSIGASGSPNSDIPSPDARWSKFNRAISSGGIFGTGGMPGPPVGIVGRGRRLEDDPGAGLDIVLAAVDIIDGA